MSVEFVQTPTSTVSFWCRDWNTMSQTKTYQGQCHCGAVKFHVTMARPEAIYDCNCSICSRAGWALAFVPADTFVLESGADAQQDYQFGKKHLHHPFCSTCGVRSFSKGVGPDGKAVVAVNLKCLSGFDAKGIPLQVFDGAAL
jgi:hypothetical protein